MRASFLDFLSTHPFLDRLTDLSVLLLKAAVILAITLLLSRVATRRLKGAVGAFGFEPTIVVLFERVLWASIWAIGILLIVYLLGSGLTPLAAFIGVVGLAASLSLQQVLQNLVAGIYLLAEHPFAIGDVVCVIGGSGLNHEGRVIDIQMRTTQLRSEDDELILVPNSAIFTGIVTNRTAVGGYATHLTVTFPRTMELEAVRQSILPLLADEKWILSQPRPRLRVDRAGKEEWTASVLFWTTTYEAKSDVVWAIAHAFPEATVDEEDAAP